ncbi:PREDICTED: uncharacterized protein LOC104738422 [Camelina sativa]|uniref:Uncharacterized protein LOC104738422 n=1 Tax=Camelina sativa TaxID=90675 RepID=A0ABM0VIW1_CAMSA|nr:PREDICTED: uncharacterized protein LOC104738422 [Camelina sativa]
MWTYIESDGLYQVGIRRGPLLADLWRRGAWKLPPARSEAQVNIHTELSMISLSDEEVDSYHWWIDDQRKDQHNTGSICSALREAFPNAPWHTIVWFSGGIPKHKFLTWLFVLDRCPTRDRLLNWGLQVDPSCMLCTSMPESRDHIFFECPFSWSIWSVVARRCAFVPSDSWSQSIESLTRYSGPRVAKKLLLIAWQSVLYTIWTERNHRLHRNFFKSADLLLRQINSTIRNRGLSFHDSNPDLSLSLLHLWFSAA